MAFGSVAVITYKAGTRADVIRSLETELTPLLRRQAGFRTYEYIATNEDSSVTVTVFDTQEQLQQAVQVLQLQQAWQQRVAPNIAAIERHAGPVRFAMDNR